MYCCNQIGLIGRLDSDVSIFALSNRVLLLGVGTMANMFSLCFNIRSVESCTAAGPHRRTMAAYRCFNIRSVESCTAATETHSQHTPSPRFNIRSVESCTAAVARWGGDSTNEEVSIFALSNRVLLPGTPTPTRWRRPSFNIRSVESCTAAFGYLEIAPPPFPRFNIRSVESCTAAQMPKLDIGCEVGVSIFALSNRVLLPQPPKFTNLR